MMQHRMWFRCYGNSFGALELWTANGAMRLVHAPRIIGSHALDAVSQASQPPPTRETAHTRLLAHGVLRPTPIELHGPPMHNHAQCFCVFTCVLCEHGSAYGATSVLVSRSLYVSYAAGAWIVRNPRVSQISRRLESQTHCPFFKNVRDVPSNSRHEAADPVLVPTEK